MAISFVSAVDHWALDEDETAGVSHSSALLVDASALSLPPSVGKATRSDRTEGDGFIESPRGPIARRQRGFMCLWGGLSRAAENGIDEATTSEEEEDGRSTQNTREAAMQAGAPAGRSSRGATKQEADLLFHSALFFM